MLIDESRSDFSVLMAVYHKDDPSLFLMAIDSVFSNSLPPVKLIVVADGQLNNELERILNMFIKRSDFYLIRLEYNVGLASALNIGLKYVQTKYTVRADSDDFNYPNRFSILISTLESGFDLAGSSILEADKHGNEIAVRKMPSSHNEIVKFASRRNPFNHMSVGFRTKVVLDALGYPSIYLREDYALWAKLISRNIRVCNIDQILVRATTGADMYRRRGGLKYTLGEIDLQLHLVSNRLKSPLMGLLDGVLRGLVFIAPNRVREYFYINFLRLKIKD
jgi:glycosyltransferase involved in cell wall biosynthesis